ncbi:MAG TPA: L,D-transpeptidase family protein [Pseudomonadales bacterium]|nr:L,D-transpeptidase family protein [Pseudomonadales bacterium]
MFLVSQFFLLRMQRAVVLGVMALLLCILSACTTPPEQAAGDPRAAVQPQKAETKSETTAKSIAVLLKKGRHTGLLHPDFSRYREVLSAAYAEHDNAPFWLDNGNPNAKAKQVLELLAKAPLDGLNPRDYDVDWLNHQVPQLNENVAANSLARFDVALSVAYARLIHDVHAGRVAPRDAGFMLENRSREAGANALIKRAFGNESPDALYAAARPQFSLYKQMVATLATYRELAAKRSRPDLSALDASLHPGESWRGVPALAEWLEFLGDYSGGNPAGNTYSAALAAGVKRFQERHAIDADGVIGKGTYNALNTPLSQRVHQIELSLERLRWVDEDLANERAIIVNIPQYRLWAFPGQPGVEPMTMNVVVGSSVETNTPILLDQIERVIFNPYWNVPTSITKKELLPKLRKDPNYLVTENMELVGNGQVLADPPTPELLKALARGEYRVRQRPGAKNALGHVKFEFPNRDSIYMHDTPKHNLFQRSRRDFSHGCIRLSHPEQMAQFLLSAERNWDEQRVSEALASDKQLTVQLHKPVPVLIYYTTSLVDGDGRAVFLDDIYGYDNRLDLALFNADQQKRK